ncbi:conserved hypothetical protein [Citreicella sp. SE45]|nr:conserved hypothetical protein [Citreicella sp. SE45]
MISQSAFRHALTDAGQPVPETLLDGAGRPAERRFSVYRNNVAVSLSEALETGFPAVAALLGDANFARVAARFLRQHPPGSPLLMTWGGQFPAFLEGLDELDTMPWLPDVARSDLAMRRAYHAADATSIEPAELLALNEEALERARVTLAPAVQLLASRWPLAEIRSYALGETPERPSAGAQDIVVTRPEFDPVVSALPERGHAFALALKVGMPLGAAVTQCGAGFDPAPTLALLLGQGAITGLIS